MCNICTVRGPTSAGCAPAISHSYTHVLVECRPTTPTDGAGAEAVEGSGSALQAAVPDVRQHLELLDKRMTGVESGLARVQQMMELVLSRLGSVESAGK